MILHVTSLICFGGLTFAYSLLTEECINYLNQSATVNSGDFILDDSEPCINSTITCLEGFTPNDCKIECTSDDSCGKTIIECPSYLYNNDNNRTFCEIHCDGYFSCENSIILADGGSNVNSSSSNSNVDVFIHCLDYRSCFDTTIIVSNAANMTLECDEVYACKDIKIETENVDSVTLHCHGFDGCVNGNISIFNSNEFFWECNTFETCDFTNVILTNISDKSEINCSSESCAESNWYLSNVTDFNINLFSTDEIKV